METVVNQKGGSCLHKAYLLVGEVNNVSRSYRMYVIGNHVLRRAMEKMKAEEAHRE